MLADEIRYLFAYDRWATQRVLAVLDGIEREAWSGPARDEERGIGAILVHQLGAAQRWRTGFQTQGAGEGPHPEAEPLPTIDELRARWDEEWATVDAWLPTMTDDFPAIVFDGVPVWVMLLHVINHGTQHRSEAAALLTALGHSPGELDLINYADELSQAAAP